MRQLSAEQLVAVDLLMQGKSDAEVGVVVNKHRVTVTRWRLLVPEFQAELHRRRKETFGLAVDRFRTLLCQSLDVLSHELEQGTDRVHVALTVLRLAGLDARLLGSEGIGPVDPNRILDEVARQRRPSGDASTEILRLLEPLSDRERAEARAALDAELNAPVEMEDR
jgi:hypothetical protein